MKTKHEPLNVGEREFEKLIQKAERVPLEAPAFLATRVMAELKGRRESRRTLGFWKWLSAGSFATLAAGVITFFVFMRADLSAVANQAFVLSVEMKSLSQFQVARAEVFLPDDVYFYSQRHPEVRKQKMLSLPGRVLQSGEFPLAIISEKSGKREVAITFYDANNNVIAKKNIRVRFDHESKAELKI